MDWADIAKAVGGAAPILGTLVGGPAGAAVGGLIASALGTAATPDAVRAAIATDPDASLKLLQAESDNKVALQKLVFAHAETLFSAEVADRTSARDREVKTSDSWTPRILAATFVLGWLVAQGYLLSHIVDQGMREIVMRSLGTMDMALGMILSYYFGSSSGSDRKTELLAKTTPAAEPNASGTP